MTPLAPPPPGTLQVWSDLLCPFAHIALLRLRRARTRLGLDRAVTVEHRVFPLELFNGPHPRRGTDTEAVGLGPLEPGEFRVWSGQEDHYPHTVLLAAEAVHAAADQGPPAAEELDLALRRAFWLSSRSIGHRQGVLDVAAELPDGVLDVGTLADALDTGRFRTAVMTDFAVAGTDAIPGSPTFRLPDGTTVTNPGVTVHWDGPWASGFPVVDADDPRVVDDLVRRAAAG